MYILCDIYIVSVFIVLLEYSDRDDSVYKLIFIIYITSLIQLSILLDINSVVNSNEGIWYSNEVVYVEFIIIDNSIIYNCRIL